MIVVDPLIVNKADHELVARTESRLDLAALLAYSGWNTGGNALGPVLGHGTALPGWAGAPAHPGRHTTG